MSSLRNHIKRRPRSSAEDCEMLSLGGSTASTAVSTSIDIDAFAMRLESLIDEGDEDGGCSRSRESDDGSGEILEVYPTRPSADRRVSFSSDLIRQREFQRVSSPSWPSIDAQAPMFSTSPNFTPVVREETFSYEEQPRTEEVKEAPQPILKPEKKKLRTRLLAALIPNKKSATTAWDGRRWTLQQPATTTYIGRNRENSWKQHSSNGRRTMLHVMYYM